MQHPTAPGTEVSGTYGRLTITYRVLNTGTSTVTVYQGTNLRIPELCQTFTTPQAAWAEAQRVATAAFAGTPVEQIINARPSELVLAETRRIIDRVPRPTMAGAHLQPLTAPQHRAIREHRDGVVHAGDGTSWVTLQAIARKGYGTAVRDGRRSRIVAVRLNLRGLDAANTVAVGA